MTANAIPMLVFFFSYSPVAISHFLKKKKLDVNVRRYIVINKKEVKELTYVGFCLAQGKNDVGKNDSAADRVADVYGEAVVVTRCAIEAGYLLHSASSDCALVR